MGRPCTVRVHPDVEQINEDLVRRQAYLAVARTYGVSRDALRNHAREHFPELLAKAAEAERVAEGDTLLSRVEGIHRRTLAVLEAAEATQDHKLALSAIREARGNLQLVGEVTKELDRRPILNITLSPEWVSIRAVIVGSLEAFPAARESVLRALEEEDGTAG
jgi:hypothetical protein